MAEQYAGRKARCPECGYVYTVPEAPGAAGGNSATAATNSSSERPLSGPARAASTSGAVAQPSSAADSWYLKTPEGQIFGAVDRAELGQWVQEGRVSEDCQLRRGEYGSWTDAAKIFPQLAQPAYQPRQPSGAAYANPYAQPATSQPSVGSSFGGGRYVRPDRGGLILTFAILGWFFCPIFSVMAWSMGSNDINQMRSGLMDNRGMGLTQAGQILGMIHTVLILLSFGAFFLLMLCGIAAEGM